MTRRLHAPAVIVLAVAGLLAADSTLALSRREAPRTLRLTDTALLDELNAQPALPRLVLELRDAAAATVEYREVGRDLVVRGETFDPASGAIETSRAFYRDGALDVMLPVDAGAANLRLFREDQAGGLVEIGFTLGGPLRVSAALAGTPSVTTILDNGPSTNRVDLVLVGDGYAAGDMALWRQDAEAVAREFFQVEPYAQYKPYFNIHRVDALSRQSGIDHPEAGILKDTAFDATYNCGNIVRLVCVDIPAVRGTVSTLLPPAAREVVLVVVNDETHGGSGNIENAVAVTSMHANYLNLLHHELGHSFARLTDEYVDPAVVAPAACRPDEEPEAANASRFHGSRQAIKWGHWIDALTELPTTARGDTGLPGLYAGGAYCANLYRPTPNSKMQTLNRPFEAVNEEQIVLSVYRYVRPLDGYAPEVSREIVLDTDEVPRFSAAALRPNGPALDTKWYLDGVLVAGTATLGAAAVPPGRHVLELIVSDPTPKVRKDAGNRLSQRIAWAVRGLSQPRFVGDAVNLPAVLVNGTPYSATLLVNRQSGLFELEQATKLPAGTSMEGAATFAGGRLDIPAVAYNGRVFRASLELAGTVPTLRFRLLRATPL